jgi:tripartite-type tricarboxylate transporter receptor subunit TctC
MKGVALAAAVLVSALLAPAAHAEWPDHAIRWIVPFGPGGANDLIARVAAEAASKKLGQPILIENRPGATVGTQAVARASADGYTFLIGAAGVVANSLLLKNLPYQDSDLVPVGMIAVAPSVIVVNPNVPANNMAEFIAWAKTQGVNGITWSTAGSGSTPHFVAEMFKEATGVNVTIVPYRSGNDGVNAVLSNSASVTSEASIVVLPQIKAGLLKAIATTYEKRMSAYPSLMTTAEQGFPAVQIGHWAAAIGPVCWRRAERPSRSLRA